MTVACRAMTSADHAGVSVLLAMRLPGVEIEDLRLYRGYVAVQDDQIVAAALLHDHPPLMLRGGGRQALLHAFTSAEGGHGRGAGLLRYVHDRLARAGYGSILVKLVGVSGPVHEWYRRLGYQVDWVIGFEYGGDRPWWVTAAPGESHAAIVLDDSLRICEASVDVRELPTHPVGSPSSSRGRHLLKVPDLECNPVTGDGPAPIRPNARRRDPR